MMTYGLFVIVFVLSGLHVDERLSTLKCLGVHSLERIGCNLFLSDSVLLA